MPDPSNIRPVSAREILSRAATHLQMVDRDAVSAKDAQHIKAAHSLLDLLLMTEPVPFMPARPVESVPADKHTPGPWYPKPAPYGWDVWGNLDDGKDTWVGPVQRVISPHARMGSRKAIEAASEETEANARLIAAAPDLLEALRLTAEQSLRSEIPDGYGPEFVSKEWEAGYDAAISAARAAIAKAEGGAA
jgi:hypothetical protein